MDSWLSWVLWATIGLLSFQWILGAVGVSVSVWGIVLRFLRWIPGLGTTPDDSSTARPADIRQLSDAVHALHEPVGTPEIDIVFVHGLQLSGFKDAFWKTWTTLGEDGKQICWPQTWLKEEFPRARILSLSYDSSAIRTDKTGRLDPYATGESLLGEMVSLGGIGQQWPVMFVCHSLGGLIIKEVVIQANRKRGTANDDQHKKFMDNIRGFLFYATPHEGSKLADLASALPLPIDKGPMVEHLTAINNNLGRLNGDFERIARVDFLNKWKFQVVAEQHATKIGEFYAVVVPEGSARFLGYGCQSVGADHFQVCKPTSKNTTAFKVLLKFILEDVMSKTITTGEQAMLEAESIR